MTNSSHKDWLYEFDFKGRNPSGWYNQNFVARNGNIFVMDNHRAALWCWLQKLDKNKKYNLFHIDQHEDCADIPRCVEDAVTEDVRFLSLERYLAKVCDYGNGNWLPALKADNFLSFFVKNYPSQLNWLLTTGRVGNPARWKDKQIISITDLPSHIKFYMCDHQTNDNTNCEWIVDIDLDYFFYQHAGTKEHLALLAPDYIQHLFSEIAKVHSAGRIRVLTIALSPGWCGGWANAERLCEMLCNTLGVPFALPPAP